MRWQKSAGMEKMWGCKEAALELERQKLSVEEKKLALVQKILLDKQVVEDKKSLRAELGIL